MNWVRDKDKKILEIWLEIVIVSTVFMLSNSNLKVSWNFPQN